MEVLHIVPDLTKQGFRDEEYAVVPHQGSLTIGAMKTGTGTGKPIVMIGLDLADDGILVAETTLALFLSAADTLKALYGDPRQK